MTTPTTPTLARIRSLRCACCGTMTRGRQFWNQDTGYGLCDKCHDWIASRAPMHGTSPEEMARTYGEPGNHVKIGAP